MAAAGTVIFDLDGTLVDSRPGIDWALRSAAREALNREIEEETAPLIGRRVAEICDGLFPGLPLEARDSFVASFRDHYDSHGWKRAEPFPGCLETLGVLAARAYSLRLVTNKPELPTRRILEASGLDGLMGGLVCSDSCGGFDHKGTALEHLLTGLGPEQRRGVTYVGDTVEDLDAARGCSVRFVGVAYGYGAAALSERGVQLVESVELLPETLAQA